MTPKKNDEKSIDKLKRELNQAWKDIETLPITEIAARNASVFEYCQHWEGRATKAETELEKLRHGLENCRLFAARNRKESWALLILGFCAEAGVVGSVTRDFPNADHHGPDWTERDGEYLK